MSSILIFIYFYISMIWITARCKPIQQNDNPWSFDQQQVLPFQTPSCGSIADPLIEDCKLLCDYDFECQRLQHNRSRIGCSCDVELCPDGKMYAFPWFKKGKPLTDEDLKFAPHVEAPCNGCVPYQIAPYYEQIGDCAELNGSGCANNGSSLPTTKIYHPGQDVANTMPGLNPAQSLEPKPPSSSTGSK